MISNAIFIDISLSTNARVPRDAVPLGVVFPDLLAARLADSAGAIRLQILRSAKYGVGQTEKICKRKSHHPRILLD